LNVSGCTTLTELRCDNNQLTSLDVSSNTALTSLNCSYNQLTSLNVSSNTALTFLYCHINQLTSLNVSSNTALTELACISNGLTSLNVSSNTALTFLNCSFNQLTSLNVSSNTALTELACNSSGLTSLHIKNGKNETLLSFSNNPNLLFICADENQLTTVQSLINSYGYSTTCQVNSYCSFTPGGTYYTIQGTNKFDSSSNGCDALDIPFPNLKYNITNGTVTGNLISNNSGNYSIPVGAGTHTITPILENPSYFNISPTSATVTFPTTTSPFVQDFCINANGVHNDLEVTILPIGPARPGFDANYKIVYKNKGTTTQSGTVNMVLFNQTLMNFVSANPAVSSQTTGNLYWNFTNLAPFETRDILVTIHLHSPMDTPSLNAGYILSYNANITIPSGDATYDNSHTIRQTVVNSFDPNDKTCLEGDNISPAKVGDYVHYMIRFENTGTFPAQNIVVKDIIDTTKFNIETLLPVSGSHDFTTRINGDKVEFIFENINLPFDNATNDGYVAFKIKTKSTLVLGNTFSNLANIYFDYNFPIVTNTATTTVANPLATQDFEFSNYFSLYPNPVKNSLNISAKNDVVISSMSIYNTLGQLVQVITNPTNTIDVSELKTGNYFVKIVSDKGVSGSKFLKE
jgi:uncharacterized repeat protein (TIGR01451 family)